jgi:hypothetical protein
LIWLQSTFSESKAGDTDAFSQLYSRHKKRVFAIWMRMVRDFSLAEDLTQETFLQLHWLAPEHRPAEIWSAMRAPDSIEPACELNRTRKPEGLR